MKIKENILLRIYLIYTLLLLSAVAVLLKGYRIQTYKDNFWVKKAQEMSTKLFPVKGERGSIYTHDGNLLATSNPYFDLYVDFGSEAMTKDLFNDNVDSLAYYMANKFKDKSHREYKQALISARTKKLRYYPIKKRINYADLKEIKTWPLLREGKYKGGLIVETKQSRSTPYDILAKRTIGEHRSNAQPVGIEAAYNEYLAGAEGNVIKQKFAGNTWVPIDTKLSIDPKDGSDVYTTLDINIQDLTENALMKAMDSSQAEFGCAIVMDVKTGAIKAIANLGKTASGNYWELNNYAVIHNSEPGSTFKAASYLMLLDKNAIKLNDTIGINKGSWNFYGRRMHDDYMTEYSLSVREAFARSSNIAIARLIDQQYRNNKSEFYHNMVKYGLTELSGIDLIGESMPKVTKPDKWSKLSLPWRATGYEQMFSPIQILTFYNTIANNGYKARPYLVEKISKNGKLIKEFKPEISNEPIASLDAINKIKELLKSVIEHPRGTGRSILSENFEFAGKTGTAKILNRKEGGYSNANQAMFAGFFPVEQPKYSCIVMVYKPQGQLRTGGGIAAPVFKEIAEKILSTEMQIAPIYQNNNSIPYIAKIKGENQQVKKILSKYGHSSQISEGIEYINAEVKTAGIKLQPIKTTNSEVPNLIGMNLDDAIYLLENMNLKVIVEGRGKVTEQSIEPGSKVEAGQKIIITLNIKNIKA